MELMNKNKYISLPKKEEGIDMVLWLDENFSHKDTIVFKEG